MPEDSQRLHGLEGFLERNRQPSLSSSEVRAEVLGNRSYINVRGKSDDPEVMGLFQKALGHALPDQPNTVSNGDLTIYWLGPDEWLICGLFAEANDLARRIHTELAGHHIAVNDLSGGMLTIRLSGKRTRRLLSKGCTLDFHPEVFAPGHCAQSGLAKANVLIGLSNDGSAFDIIVRRSYADYLALWLHKAGQSAGIEFR